MTRKKPITRRRLSKTAAFEAAVAKLIDLMRVCDRRGLDCLEAFNEARLRYNGSDPVEVLPDADELEYQYGSSEETV